MPRLPINTEFFSLQLGQSQQIYEVLTQYEGADLEQLIISDLVFANSDLYPVVFDLFIDRNSTIYTVGKNLAIQDSQFRYPTIFGLQAGDKLIASVNYIVENLENSWAFGTFEDWVNIEWTSTSPLDDLILNSSLAIATGYLTLSIKTEG